MKLDSGSTQQELFIVDHLQAETVTPSGKQEATIIDVEVFIKQAFASDPKHGCELLFRHYYQALCSHAVRFIYSKAIAEDLVSEIFCQFYQKGTYHFVTTSYRAYLYKAVRNSAINYLRWEVNRSSDLDNYADFADLVCKQPDSVMQYEELYQHVEAAISGLPPQCRKVYVMHRFEHKKYAEIAAELQLSPRTVEAQIRKASQFMKDVLHKKLQLILVCCHTWLAAELVFSGFLSGIFTLA